jgi:phosphohistidine phosphatase SixA
LLIAYTMLYESCYGNKLVFCAGRVQADLTEYRLKVLGLPYMHILHSPMTRAKQTADIVHKHLVCHYTCLCVLEWLKYLNAQ